MRKNTGLNFTYRIADVEEMIKQIEMFLKTSTQNLHLQINDIRIYFNEIKYEKYDYESENLCELSFLKNNDIVAYIEIQSNYKIECNFINNILYEIKILKPNEID